MEEEIEQRKVPSLKIQQWQNLTWDDLCRALRQALEDAHTYRATLRDDSMVYTVIGAVIVEVHRRGKTLPDAQETIRAQKGSTVTAGARSQPRRLHD